MEKNMEQKPMHNKCWDTFAKVGKILGISSLATFFLPFFVGVAGIIFSCLGTNANTEEGKKSKKIGLITSIISIVLNVAVLILLILIPVIIAMNEDKSLITF